MGPHVSLWMPEAEWSVYKLSVCDYHGTRDNVQPEGNKIYGTTHMKPISNFQTNSTEGLTGSIKGTLDSTCGRKPF